MKKTDSPKPAKLCYDHIGGKLGTLLFHHFIEKEWIAKVQTEDKHYIITQEGEKGFKKMGIDLSEIQ